MKPSAMRGDPSRWIAPAVAACLRDADRSPKYRGHKNPMTGQCYVASEAVYHLAGGKRAGLKPMHVRHEGEPHWFLQKANGEIVDVTASQFRTPVPYELAKGKGFLTKKPSKRAKAVIERTKRFSQARRTR